MISASLVTELTAMISHIDIVDLGIILERDIYRYAQAIGETNKIYYDRDAARHAGYRGLVAPPNMILSLVGGSSPQGTLRQDGTTGEHLRGLTADGVRIMGGGEATEFLRPVIAGDVVTLTSTLDSVTVKDGRAGQLVVATYLNAYADSSNHLLAKSRRTMLIR